MTKPPTKEYRCDSCGGTFESRWTDAEANAEFEAAFCKPMPDDVATVCDVCYKRIMGSMFQ